MNLKRNSDIDIFRETVGQYQDRLFRFAFMRIGMREAAEDIVQEVFIRFYRALSEGKTIKSHEYYLLQSISNACIDWIRKKKISVISIEDAGDIAEEKEEDISDEFRRINMLLEGLPFIQAETVRLKCYDSLTFRQIAELHGVAEATVKSRYRHAIMYIKEKLNQNKPHD